MQAIAIALLTLTTAQYPNVCPQEQVGWLFPGYRPKTCVRPVPYVPREGDIVLYTWASSQFRCLFCLARTGAPYHSGVVVRRYDGSLALLESGSGDKGDVSMKSVAERLCPYHEENEQAFIWIRPIRRPLTPQQSHRLTCFAEAQVGKPFASSCRLFQMSFPCRGRLVSRGRQGTWYCSELVSQALMGGGLIRPGAFEPSHVAPRHLLLDEEGVNLRCGWYPRIPWNNCPKMPAPGPSGTPY